MKISIVTPSLNMLDYLKRCHASVADQDGAVQVDHIVKDAGSTDGTVEWLQEQSDLSYHVGKDAGMYDAINQGIELAHGDIIGYLNCDEQYLPGALTAVTEHFHAHPNADIVFGDVLLIGPDGELLAYRKGYPLRWLYVASSHLYIHTCAMFFRREIFDQGLTFDSSYRSIGDQVFVMRALRNGYTASHIRHYLSAFTVTGSNLSANSISKTEKEHLLASLSNLLKLGRWPLNIIRLVEKLFSGAYHQEMPVTYAIYTDNLSERTNFRVTNGTFRWPDS